MPSSSSEYKIPDFVLAEAMQGAAPVVGAANAVPQSSLMGSAGHNGDDLGLRVNAEGWLTAAPVGAGAASPTTLGKALDLDAPTPAHSTSEDWSIYQELTAIAEEIQRCRAGAL